MDDRLSAARRCGAVRKLLWPHGKKRRGFMHGRRWMAAALVLLICALTVFGIVLLNGGGSAPAAEAEKRSEGVLALSDFLRTYSDNWEILSAGTLAGMAQRLMSEPFEIYARITAESEGLKGIGLPIASLPASLHVKYDLRDFGFRLNAMGTDMFAACVTGDELIAVPADGTAQTAQVPVSGDVSGDMTLKDRIGRFVPLPPKGLVTRLLDILAESVPEECTRMELGRAYSPMDQKDVNVTLIHTSLDAEALAVTAAAFSAALSEDAALYDEAENWVAETAAWLGESGVTLDNLLSQTEGGKYGKAAVTWKVYRRGETPVGFSLSADTPDARYDVAFFAEFDAGACAQRMEIMKDGVQLFVMEMTADGGEGELTAEAAQNGNPVNVKAAFRLGADTSDSYHLFVDATVTGRLLTENTDTLHIIADADIDIGSGLGMLASENGWRDMTARKNEK